MQNEFNVNLLLNVNFNQHIVSIGVLLRVWTMIKIDTVWDERIVHISRLLIAQNIPIEMIERNKRRSHVQTMMSDSNKYSDIDFNRFNENELMIDWWSQTLISMNGSSKSSIDQNEKKNETFSLSLTLHGISNVIDENWNSNIINKSNVCFFD